MAFREVLGRVPSTRDPRSFVTALNQSFDIRQVEGHAEFTWNPRGYAGQADLGGGVTGYQASLYKRATVMLDNALPLLDGLYTLNTNTDKEDSEAVRSIIRSTLRELVREIGLEGGPRRERVAGFFGSLLNQGGQLDELRSMFALSQAKVNTLEEEANYSNYVALRDYVQSLRDGWDRFVKNTQATPDLGTSMVQLSRALSVAGEGVDEVYWALESVLISEAERRVITIPGSQMKLDDYFTWASHFTKIEAPNLIYEAGKRGVRQIKDTIPQLAGILANIRRMQQPDGLAQSRVQNLLYNLEQHLIAVHNIAVTI